jgi:hypothetical protein
MCTKGYPKTRIKLLLSIVLSLSLLPISCSQKESCEQLSQKFETYNSAVEIIKSTDFKIEESVNTFKSTWIKHASYYSCDGQTGFFILETSQKEYLYADLPYEVWKEFKSADSFGSFYNTNIRYKYNFSLTK